MYKVIDISTHQKNVDYQSVKNDGIEGVILRVGVTGYGYNKRKTKDALFETHYKGFKDVGLPIIGVYWYSCAYTEDEAITEANLSIEFLKGKDDIKWIWFDTEDNHNIYNPLYANTNQVRIGKRQLTNVAKTFLKQCQAKGYNSGIYASKSWLENQLIMSELNEFDVWLAQYASKPTYKGLFTIWQYSSQGKVKGVYGNTDMNWCYKDYFNDIPSKPIEEKPLTKRYLYLSKLVPSWRVYPLHKDAKVGNEIGKLAPMKFGGLKYEILDDLGNSVYVIKTQTYGKVKIYAGKNTLSTIKEE